MIMKNEEKFIGEALKRLSLYNCEIVIADTGSTDKSIEIARNYTDKIYHFDWVDDFSAARNYSISKANNDIIFVLDCDEFIEEANFDELEKAAEENPYGVGYVRRLSRFTRDGLDYISNEDIARVFSRKYFHYEGIIHEQVRENEGVCQKQYNTGIVMTHAGYDGPEIIREKAKRNIELLEKEYKKDNTNTYILYQLGKSYYVQNDYENAVIYLKKCAELKPDMKFSYVHEMYNIYAYALINSKKINEAVKLLDYYDELAITADFVFAAGLIYINCGKLSQAVGEFQKALTMKNAKIQGVNSFAANYNIGVIYECVGDKKEALSYYEKCGDYKPAVEGIKRITQGGI